MQNISNKTVFLQVAKYAPWLGFLQCVPVPVVVGSGSSDRGDGGGNCFIEGPCDANLFAGSFLSSLVPSPGRIDGGIAGEGRGLVDSKFCIAADCKTGLQLGPGLWDGVEPRLGSLSVNSGRLIRRVARTVSVYLFRWRA